MRQTPTSGWTRGKMRMDIVRGGGVTSATRGTSTRIGVTDTMTTLMRVSILMMIINHKTNSMNKFRITDKRVNSIFVWRVVTDVAEMLYEGSPFAFEYHELFPDGSERWLKNLQEIRDAIANGNDIGIEVGWVPTN